MKESALPIDEVLPDIKQAIQNHPNCILHAPPGAGKTTRVPLALLDMVPLSSGRILMLEPRRLATVSAARWMAHSCGEEVGQTVGYSIRFDSCTSAKTRIEVVTEGILTRRIQNDPLLEGVAVVIFDEFHERSLHADLGLALCLDVQRQVRNDLKILVMSATLECQPLSQLLGNAPVISSLGRSYPVKEIYLEDQSHSPLPQRVAAVVRRALSETEGDVLVFLPGSGEIRACARRLSEAGLSQDGIVVCPLYGDLPFEEQRAAILPCQQRKVILATSIAETSLTVEGVGTVIDCGLSRRIRYDRSSGMNRLVTVRESKSSAEQRKGRAGRVAPGTCYRMFSRHTYNAMIDHSPPEILSSDLSALVLEMAVWGVADPLALAWLDPPPVSGLEAARSLLTELSALDSNGRITALGNSMAQLPLHPRLAALQCRSRQIGCYNTGCDLAALLSERDIIRRGMSGECDQGMTDISERLELLRSYRSNRRTSDTVDLVAIKSVGRVASQLRHPLGESASDCNDRNCVSRLLLAAYPDQVAIQREPGSLSYVLANGRGARLASAGPIQHSSLLIAIAVDSGDLKEGIIHLAEPLDTETLISEAGGRIAQIDRLEWDYQEGRVVAVRERHYGGITLSSVAFTPSPGTSLPIVIEAVRNSGLEMLNREDRFRQLQARVNLMRKVFPEGGWPDLSDAALLDTLDKWLAPHLSGVRSAQQLLSVDCASALSMVLDYQQKQTLEKLSPTHVTVPSGSRIKLDYCAGDQPVLAVKLQELFGLAETPDIAGGRVKVLLHLLSPAGRPIQVTSDLKGFWDGSYHQVKKELKGRYPKHPWPDDPWGALPTRRAKPGRGHN